MSRLNTDTWSLEQVENMLKLLFRRCEDQYRIAYYFEQIARTFMPPPTDILWNFTDLRRKVEVGYFYYRLYRQAEKDLSDCCRDWRRFLEIYRGRLLRERVISLSDNRPLQDYLPRNVLADEKKIREEFTNIGKHAETCEAWARQYHGNGLIPDPVTGHL
jgi:hypothetical protein